MESVNQLLQTKGHEIWSVTPEILVFDALKLMADKNVGALLDPRLHTIDKEGVMLV